MNDVLRQEKKFQISISEMAKREYALRQILHEDPHNGPDGYIVRSLYFDTEYDGDFFDKEYGMEVRKKLRLRIYDLESRTVMLEMKQKQGEQQRKRSLRLFREDAKRLIACDYSPLLRYPDSFAAECFALMNTRCCRPKAIVQYRRKAYMARENRTRITFDHQIDATVSCFDLFSPGLLLNPVLDRSQAVLEVKYNGFLLSYIKQMINNVDKPEVSVSKYTLARQLTYYPNA